ncbi:MAG: ATPase inhibitor subunit zeta, partial [Oricola sp.]
AEAYAKEVILSDLEEAGDEDVFRKLRADFDAAGVEQSDHQIRRTMDELLPVAIEQVKND